MSQSNPTPPLLTNIQTTPNLKRKLGQRISKPLSLDQVQLPSVTETMSHVEIPGTQSSSKVHPDKHDISTQKLQVLPEGANGHAATNETGSPYYQSQGPSPSTLPNIATSPSTLPPGRIVFNQHQSPSIMTASRVKAKIQEQFSLELMIKHRELRLIEQELAKCQVAMEQLRRCNMIPFPAWSPNAPNPIATSEDSGPASHNTAPYAPPWGTSDGPYSRHYGRWLLPDPTFDDSIGEEPQVSAAAGKRLPDRVTRGWNSEKGLSGGQARSNRGSVGRLNVLPQGHSETKEDKGPMVVERKSDHHRVKLVCLDCRRFNFNSVQGFINHCRIAHARQFASHDVAIEASGEEIDGELEGGMVSESNIQQSAASAGLVHPMIRSARPPPSEASNSPLPLVEEKDPSRASTPVAGGSHISIMPPTFPSTPLRPSPQTPHLSAFFARAGRGGDLDATVLDAKRRDEINLVMQMEEEESSNDEPDEPAIQSRSTRGPAQCSVRPTSSHQAVLNSSRSSSQDEYIQHPKAGARATPAVQSPLYRSSFSAGASPGFEDQGGSVAEMTPSNFSPNTTDPHPAPSLVSDDGDLDHTHSESEASSQPDIDEHHDHYLHPVFHHDDLELGESNGFEIAHESKQPSSTIDRRPRPPTSIHENGREERHVTFASPVRRG